MSTKKQTLDEIVGQIAKEYCGVETLECRGRDHLDFHDIGVVSLEKALKAAYNKGRLCEIALAEAESLGHVRR